GRVVGAGVQAGGPAAARDGGGGEQRARDGGAAARTSVAGRGDRRSHPLRAGRDRAFGERAQPEGEVAPDVARGDGALGRARHRRVQGSGGTRSDRDPADADRRAVALTAVRTISARMPPALADPIRRWSVHAHPGGRDPWPTPPMLRSSPARPPVWGSSTQDCSRPMATTSSWWPG